MFGSSWFCCFWEVSEGVFFLHLSICFIFFCFRWQMLIVFEFIKVEWRDLIDFFGRGELRKLELMQLSLKPVKRRHQLCQPSNPQYSTTRIPCRWLLFWKKSCDKQHGGQLYVWNHIYCFSVTNFPHKWRHSRGGIFVVDQRKSDLQNSLFMILNHVRGSDIDFGNS